VGAQLLENLYLIQYLLPRTELSQSLSEPCLSLFGKPTSHLTKPIICNNAYFAVIPSGGIEKKAHQYPTYSAPISRVAQQRLE
jgi:hypothetical protein